jgi:hypothetical protein
MTKLSPFRYPKSKHRRIFSPPQRSSYRTYRPILRDEFGKRCVYCALPDRLKGKESFGVDHYRPKKKFPNLETEYSNLFYACNICNSRKGDFWPSCEQIANKQFIPNPCDHVMYSYLRAAGPRIDARNETGRFALDVLDLNDPQSIAYRQIVIDTCSALNTELRSMKGVKGTLVAQIGQCLDDLEKNDLRLALDELDQRLHRVQGLLRDLLGGH